MYINLLPPAAGGALPSSCGVGRLVTGDAWLAGKRRFDENSVLKVLLLELLLSSSLDEVDVVCEYVDADEE